MLVRVAAILLASLLLPGCLSQKDIRAVAEREATELGLLPHVELRRDYPFVLPAGVHMFIASTGGPDPSSRELINGVLEREIGAYFMVSTAATGMTAWHALKEARLLGADFVLHAHVLQAEGPELPRRVQQVKLRLTLHESESGKRVDGALLTVTDPVLIPRRMNLVDLLSPGLRYYADSISAARLAHSARY